jgi:hypothetical protein
VELLLPHESSSLAGPIVLKTLNALRGRVPRQVCSVLDYSRGNVHDKESAGKMVDEKLEQRRVGVRPSRTLTGFWPSAEARMSLQESFVPKT